MPTIGKDTKLGCHVSNAVRLIRLVFSFIIVTLPLKSHQ